ncbi:MAG: MlaD family protein [Solirubrobacteraceae bacterium]
MSAVGIRRVLSVLLLGAFVLVLVLALRPPSTAGTLIAEFSSATNVLTAQEVRIGGVRVGEVGAVQRAPYGARVTLKIQDAGAWPLHRGTVAALRFGTTVADGGRYIELTPGPNGAPLIGDGGVLPLGQTVTPVEFDQVFDTLDTTTRAALRKDTGEFSSSFGGHASDLAHGVQAAPNALGAVANVMDELAANQTALSGLVSSAARTSDAIDARNADLHSLLTTTAATFDELANNSSAIQSTLVNAPGAMRQAQHTLAHTNTSLTTLQTLINDLGPGAIGLRQVAPIATSAVGSLSLVAPQAAQVLATARSAAPDITSLLTIGQPVVHVAGLDAQTAGSELSCVRPYTPDLAAFITNWAGFAANVDAQGHYMRAQIQATPVPNGTPLNSAQSTRLLGLNYAFPTPPGWSAGQTWSQPQCGAGPNALNPNLDPETVR